MKNNRHQGPFGLAYYVAQVARTRHFGHTYVHIGGRSQFSHGDITFYVTSFGRSLQSGGNKYKVLAYRDGKPVPSTVLLAELRAFNLETATA